MAHTKNKTKYWRRATETIMVPQDVESTNEQGEKVTTVVDMPYVLKGRNLRDYHRGGGQMRGMPSGLLINLMVNAGYVNMVTETENIDPNVPVDVIEQPVETV